MKTVGLIYLAAGNASRFGENKLLCPVEGKPLYRHGLERLTRVCAQWDGRGADSPMRAKLYVVSRSPEILAAAQEAGGCGVFGERSGEGASYSIGAGLAAAEDVDAWAFFVADQPWLKEDTIRGFLLDMGKSGARLGCVSAGGHPGNPCWFDASLREELLALRGDAGGRRVIRAHPNECRYYAVADERELTDIDVPADLHLT